MKFATLAPISLVSIAVALACGTGTPVHAEAVVTEEQAARVTAAAAAEVRNEHSRQIGARQGEEPLDMKVIETVVVSEPNESPAWFPALDESRLTLSPSPVQVTALPSGDAGMGGHFITNEHAVIPLPPAVWSGLAALSTLATINYRKSIKRFFL